MTALERTQAYIADLSASCGEPVMPDLADLCIHHGVYHLSPSCCLLAADGESLGDFAPGWVPDICRTPNHLIVIWATGNIRAFRQLAHMYQHYRFFAWARELRGAPELRVFPSTKFQQTNHKKHK